MGGKDQQPGSVDPKEPNLFYMPTNNWCMELEPQERTHTNQGTVYVFANVYMYPEKQGTTGKIKKPLVTIAGTTSDGKAGPGSAGGDSIARLIDEGVASGKLKALVVRIDSGGGSVTASEVIRQSILQALAEQSRIVRLPLNRVGSLNKISKNQGWLCGLIWWLWEQWPMWCP